MMLRGAAACVYRSCRNAASGLKNVGSCGHQLAPRSSADLCRKLVGTPTRGISTSDKGPTRDADVSEETLDEDGPLGRVMTERRMKKQVESLQPVDVLHSLQRLTHGRKKFSSLEYSPFLSKINDVANLAARPIPSIASGEGRAGRPSAGHLSALSEAQAQVNFSKVAPAIGGLSPERDGASVAGEATASSSVPAVQAENKALGAKFAFPRQRLHLHATKGRTFEFSVGYNMLSNGLQDKLKLLSESVPNELESDINEILASSVVKKRRKKMNKHKYKKRRKRDRARSM